MAGATESIKEKTLMSIPEFFRGKNIFVTGVTGFMGKVLLEKLLRSCPDIGLCYVLVRPKKGVQPMDRIKHILHCKLFEKVKREQPGVEGKVVPVCGDILEPHFGMSSEDQHRVCEDTSIVFHSAATVKFDEELKLSVQMNVIGVRHLSILCRKMAKLQSLVHVSTAYANCDREHVAEQVYDPPLDPHKLIDAIEWMDTETIGALTTKLIGSRPNTYTYTKAMAEALLVEEAKDLPVAIVRPSIVGASWEEPVPGWVDNLNGPTGLLVAIGKGLLRSMLGNFHATADLIPVDIATNAMIAAAWYTGVEKPSTTLVYNCTTGQMNRFTWGQMERLSHKFFIKNPCNTVARVPNPRFTLSSIKKAFSVTLDHLLPAYLMDAYLRLVGRRPMFVRIQDRIWKAVATLEFFTTRQWNFRNDNIFMLLSKLSTEDKKSWLMTFCTRVYYVTHCSNKYGHSQYLQQRGRYDGPRLSHPIVLPYYQFEPRKKDEERRPQDAAPNRANRIGNTDWCQCGHCCQMPTSVECVCCHDVRQIKQKVEGLEEQVGCITAHPGFRTVCLDIYCLETAYYAYKQNYGRLNFDLHEKYRYVAYRQLVRWCWGFLGKSIRVPLPACAVKTIRDTFPDGGRVGFKLPQLEGIV